MGQLSRREIGLDRVGDGGSERQERSLAGARADRAVLLIPVATGLRARMLGLALLDRADAGPGLLIPRCSSVHTFGMRFALDLHFLDAGGSVLAVRRAVPPRRFAACRGAAAVLELPAFEDPGRQWLTGDPCAPAAGR